MTLTRTIDQTAVPAAGTWSLDPAHTTVTITARHLMVTKVRGTFPEISGEIKVTDDPAESSVVFTAAAASIATGVADRDNHLRSPDFLDVANYPEIRFESTGLEPDDGAWKLTGDLTIRDVTRPVAFDLAFEGAVTDPMGNSKSFFTAHGEIDREDWGLTWNVPLDGGGVLVSRHFQIDVEAQAVLRS
jgi:polyisoprenoid-binding protein YceI